jgi:hypothetical protein
VPQQDFFLAASLFFVCCAGLTVVFVGTAL